MGMNVHYSIFFSSACLKMYLKKQPPDLFAGTINSILMNQQDLPVNHLLYKHYLFEEQWSMHLLLFQNAVVIISRFLIKWVSVFKKLKFENISIRRKLPYIAWFSQSCLKFQPFIINYWLFINTRNKKDQEFCLLL